MTHKIAVNWLAFLHALSAIPSSVTPPETGNPEIYFLFSSDPLRKSWENILKLATIAFFLFFSTHQGANRPCVLKTRLQIGTLKKAEASMEQACSWGSNPVKSQTASEFYFMNYMTWKTSCLAGCKNLEAFTLRLWAAYAANKCQCGSKVSMNPSVRHHK